MAIHISPLIQRVPQKPIAIHLPKAAAAGKSVTRTTTEFEALLTGATRPSNTAGASGAMPSTTPPATPSSPPATPTSSSAAGLTVVPPPSNATPVTPVDTSSDGPAGPLFGPNPWVTDPTGSGPGPQTHYSSFYFATPQTAQTVANMVGGTVVAMNAILTAPGSPFTQDQPNLMVQLPNGGLINPGLVATFFTHNWPTSFVNQQIANEVAGAPTSLT